MCSADGIRIGKGITDAMLAEKFLTAVSGCVLVGAMAALNDQFSQFMAGLAQEGPWMALSMATDRSIQMTRLVTGTIASVTGDHSQLVMFGVAAVVLMGLMFRS
jgi:hypothetical protein